MSLPTALSDLFDKKFHPGAADRSAPSLTQIYKQSMPLGFDGRGAYE